MSNIFTIQINPFKAPFMRHRQDVLHTVTKEYVNNKVEYHEFLWNNPKAGRNIRYEDTNETVAERERHMVNFMQRVNNAYEKALVRYNNTYAGINYEDEVVSIDTPYSYLPEVKRTIMSQKWRDYLADKQFLQTIVSRLRIKWEQVMSLAQQGKYKQIGDALYNVHVYYLALSSLCRPCSQQVVYRGDSDPLLANRK